MGTFSFKEARLLILQNSVRVLVPYLLVLELALWDAER
jgi:hypothetical protein